MNKLNLITEQEAIENIAQYYGLKPQLDILQEECAELIQAASKFKRGNYDEYTIPSSLIEELADVEIMLNQIEYLLGDDVRKEIGRVKKDKIKRQLGRIEDECLEVLKIEETDQETRSEGGGSHDSIRND